MEALLGKSKQVVMASSGPSTSSCDGPLRADTDLVPKVKAQRGSSKRRFTGQSGLTPRDPTTFSPTVIFWPDMKCGKKRIMLVV